MTVNLSKGDIQMKPKRVMLLAIASSVVVGIGSAVAQVPDPDNYQGFFFFTQETTYTNGEGAATSVRLWNEPWESYCGYGNFGWTEAWVIDSSPSSWIVYDASGYQEWVYTSYPALGETWCSKFTTAGYVWIYGYDNGKEASAIVH